MSAMVNHKTENADLPFVLQFLSMKLATVNPRLDLNIEGLLSKDVCQQVATSLYFHYFSF